MSGIYTREEIEAYIGSIDILLKSIDDGVRDVPQIKPSVIAKIIDNYKTRLKECFGIEG